MTGGYVRLAGHDYWMVREGSGDPVVVLHGGLDHSESLHGTFRRLADHFDVISFDRRGHGRTGRLDAARDYTYEAMAEQVALVVEHVGVPAHLIGWSDGGNAALLTALARPDVVKRLVLFGANYHHRGIDPAMFESPEPSDEQIAAWAHGYGQISPDGASAFVSMRSRTLAMWASAPTMTVRQLESITAPTLVAVGESEPILWEHTQSLVRALPNASLWVKAGATHDLPIEFPDEAADRVRAFLTAP